jgi:cysteinyl-tRNA synthetase
MLSDWDPMVFRLFVLSTHYRTPIDFSEEHLNQSSSNLNRLKNTIKNLKDISDTDFKGKKSNIEIDLLNNLSTVKKDFYKHMDDDFNTPRSLAILLNFTKTINNIINEINQNPEKGKPTEFIEKTLNFFESIESIFKLNLFKEDSKSYDDLLNVLIESREKLRQEKNYELSDFIRDKLKEIGIDIEDK